MIIVQGLAGYIRRMERRAMAARTFTTVGVRELAHAVKDVVDPILYEETPKATEALAKGTSAAIFDVGRGAIISWTTDAPYVNYVIQGTGIYAGHQAWDVYGLQVFQVGGQTVFTRATHHEGAKPNDYPGRTIERSTPPIAAIMRVFGDKLLVSFA